MMPPNLSLNPDASPAALERVDEALTTLGGGQGVVVFYGMAKPVKLPMVGPVRVP